MTMSKFPSLDNQTFSVDYNDLIKAGADVQLIKEVTRRMAEVMKIEILNNCLDRGPVERGLNMLIEYFSIDKTYTKEDIFYHLELFKKTLPITPLKYEDT